MSRLPSPGGDDGQWGNVLNDFLLQAHTASGSLKSGSVSEAAIANNAVTTTKLGADITQRLEAIESKINSYASISLSLFGIATPQELNTSNSEPLELGTRFYSEAPGTVKAIRFWKSVENTGAHTGTLRNSSGLPIASVAFTDETPSGWQTQFLDTPIPIAANTEYIVTYFNPTGNFARSQYLFDNSIQNGWLHAPASTAQAPNGIYRTGGPGAPDMPAYNNSGYFVDIIFSPTN